MTVPWSGSFGGGPYARPNRWLDAGNATEEEVSWSSHFARADRSFDRRLLLESMGWQVALFGVRTQVVVEADDVIGDVIGDVARDVGHPRLVGPRRVELPVQRMG